MHSVRNPSRTTAVVLAVSSATALALWSMAAPATADETEPRQAAATGALQVVVDSSGSMAAKDPLGGSKIAAAQAALGDVVDALPAGATVGVRAYGGTYADKARGCTDTRLLVPMARLDRAAAKAAFTGLRPVGYTPISTSLQRAAADFTNEGPRRILLISDGEETCGGSPCATAATLKRSGIDLVVDTVGYAADAATRSQLSCIARATGGTYSQVANGAELSEQVARTALRVFREYDIKGQRVTGTPGLVGAPLLRVGTFEDEIGKGAVLHYRLDLPAGASPFVAATLVPPRSDYSSNSYEGVRVSIASPSGKQCASEVGTPQDQSRGVMPVTSVVDFQELTRRSDGTPLYDCDVRGTYDVRVERTSSRTDVDKVPVELVVLLEPPVRNGQDLPAPTIPLMAAPPKATVAAGGRSVTGSGSFSEAPTLQPGTYRDSLRPGESSFYRVPVGWGQRLSVTAVVEPAVRGPIDTGQMVGARMNLLNPVRQVLDANGKDSVSDYVRETTYAKGPEDKTLHAWTAPIDYRNREAGRTPELAKASIAGEHFVQLSLEDYVSDKEGPAGLLPVTMVVEVLGEVRGTPEFGSTAESPAGSSTAAEPTTSATTDATATPAAPPADPSSALDDEAQASDSSSTRTIAYAGGGVVAALLAGLLLLLPWLRTRRAGRAGHRPPPPAS